MKENSILTRREMLRQSLKAGAALGVGALALGSFGGSFGGTFGDIDPFISKAIAGIPKGSLDYLAAEPCVLTCSATLGPCYFNTGLVRRNIVENQPGMPTRLGFRVVNADTCEPVSGASIDIWHTRADGVYSAPISQFCNGTDPAVQAARFCRGVQTTDASGWAYFDTIYPGWYQGRVTHIHATIRLGATNIVTTQFFFLDRVSEFIYRSHPNYSNRPNRDTTNISDNVIGGNLNRVLPYLMSTRMAGDRYLQAVKTIGIRTTPTGCAA